MINFEHLSMEADLIYQRLHFQRTGNALLVLVSALPGNRKLLAVLLCSNHECTLLYPFHNHPLPLMTTYELKLQIYC